MHTSMCQHPRDENSPLLTKLSLIAPTADVHSTKIYLTYCTSSLSSLCLVTYHLYTIQYTQLLKLPFIIFIKLKCWVEGKPTGCKRPALITNLGYTWYETLQLSLPCLEKALFIVETAWAYAGIIKDIWGCCNLHTVCWKCWIWTVFYMCWLVFSLILNPLALLELLILLQILFVNTILCIHSYTVGFIQFLVMS